MGGQGYAGDPPLVLFVLPAAVKHKKRKGIVGFCFFTNLKAQIIC